MKLVNVKRIAVTEDMNEHLKGTKICVVDDFDTEFLQKMVDFGLHIFGELGMNEWGLVPQVKHGRVFVLTSVANEKKDILGIAIFMRDWEDLDKCYLFDYAIAKKLQNKGIGYSFLSNISEYLLNKGLEKISLTVDAENKPAVRLYHEKMGFKIQEYREDLYGKGHHRYIMELNIRERK